MRREQRLTLIGAASGLVGFLVLGFAPLDDISPFSQWLVGLIASGGTMLALLTGTAGWE